MTLVERSTLSGHLTLEKWLQWRGSISVKSDLVETNSVMTKLTFSVIEDSEVLVKNFLSYPRSVQYYIYDKISSPHRSRLEEIEVTASLRTRLYNMSKDETSSLSKSGFDWNREDYSYLKSYAMQRDSKFPVKTYDELISRFIFCMFPDYEPNSYYLAADSVCTLEAIWMLTVLYDDQLTSDLLDRIVDSGIRPALHEIILLADHWIDLEGFPIDWRLRVLTDSRDIESTNV